MAVTSVRVRIFRLSFAQAGIVLIITQALGCFHRNLTGMPERMADTALRTADKSVIL